MTHNLSGERAALIAVRSFARARGLEESLAVEVYEHELHVLDDRARVKKFVPVLAEKHAKDRLRAIGA